MDRLSNFWYQSKRYVITVFLIISIIIGLVLGFVFKENPSLNAMGSTTVLPLFESLSQRYFNETGGRINVSPGGSSVGLRFIQLGKINFGNSSRYPQINKEEYQSHYWQKNISTIELGYDCIVFAINLNGTGFKLDPNNKNKFYITPKQIIDLYTGKYASINQMLMVHPEGLIKSGIIEGNSKITMREVGSGTRDAFFSALESYGAINPEQEFLAEQSVDKLFLASNGLTAETIIKLHNILGFVSLGSIANLKQKDGIVLAPIKLGSSPHEVIYDPNSTLFKPNIYENSISVPRTVSSYNFWHPLITTISINDQKIDLIWRFFNWFTNNQELVDQNGYIPLLGYKIDQVREFVKSDNYMKFFINYSDWTKKLYPNISLHTIHFDPTMPWWTWYIDPLWLSGEVI